MAMCLFIANNVHYANKLPNIEIAAIPKISAHTSWFFTFLKKKYGTKYITFLMKQKTRFKILEISVISYRPMNGQYMGIGLKKAI